MDSLTQSKKNKWWLEEVPCLHRIHSKNNLKGAHDIQEKIGMSITLDKLVDKLLLLSDRLAEYKFSNNVDCKAILTFDDGHRDILKLVPILAEFPAIQPVVFLTGNLLRGDCRALPITAFYKWCYHSNMNPNKTYAALGFDRVSLKLMPESQQRIALTEAGIDTDPHDERMLNQLDVDFLIENNWLIGYHGSSHCDLRIYSPNELKESFYNDYQFFCNPGYVPWLAWPEGFWNNSLYTMAETVGFEKQFGLKGEARRGTFDFMVDRLIWR